jgi:hypothetical protein
MKKILVITLHNGRVIERDITNEKDAQGKPLPIGVPANDTAYAMLCLTVCLHGCSDPELTSEKQYVHIAPSFIQTVAVEFRSQMKAS